MAHDNRNHTGANWTGQSPRTFREAFPTGASLYTGPRRRRRRVWPWLAGLAVVAVLALAGHSAHAQGSVSDRVFRDRDRAAQQAQRPDMRKYAPSRSQRGSYLDSFKTRPHVYGQARKSEGRHHGGPSRQYKGRPRY